MERAAFKLTPEMSAVFGGFGSDNWKRYSDMCVAAFLALREHATTITTLTEVMAHKSILPCFNQPGGGGKRCLNELRARLMMKSTKERAATRFAKKVRAAHGHLGTMWYEKFQLSSNGIEPVH
jgi:phosphatidylinositol kinase/protein kinase (PI-3  family)